MPEGNPTEDESQNTFLVSGFRSLVIFFRVFTFLEFPVGSQLSQASSKYFAEL
jgi:hypothetical protein